MKKTFIIIIIIFLVQIVKASEIDRCDINIYNEHDRVEIRGHKLLNNKWEHIKSILGKPDRVEKIKKLVRIEAWPYEKGGKRHSYLKERINYYYIYDKLGFMLKVDNKKSSYNKNPNYLIIVYKNRREFNNKEKLKFLPKIKYKSSLRINEIIVNPDLPITNKEINFKTGKFLLFGRKFSPTSYAMMIDSIYAFERKPGIRIYLNNNRDKKVSYIEIFIG